MTHRRGKAHVIGRQRKSRNVKQYINQGNSVTTPAALKKAIESNEGIKGGACHTGTCSQDYWTQENQVGRYKQFVQLRDNIHGREVLQGL